MSASLAVGILLSLSFSPSLVSFRPFSTSSTAMGKPEVSESQVTEVPAQYLRAEKTKHWAAYIYDAIDIEDP